MQTVLDGFYTATHVKSQRASRGLRRSTIVTMGMSLLIACAPLRLNAASIQAPDAAPPATEAAPAAAKGVPPVKLTPEILYQLVLSEIAAQRGMGGAAFATLYGLAGSTGDARIAQRAAELALMSRQPANALLAARLWNTLAPDSAEGREALLNLLVLNGKLDEVESLVQNDLAEPTTRASTLMQIHALLARSPQPAEAFLAMERLTKPYPRLPEARLALAQSAQRADKKERALQEVRAALALKPDWELAVLIGAQILEDDKPREASALLSQFLGRNPDARPARMALGRTLAADKRYTEAAAQFQIVLNSEPDQLDAIYSMGLLSMQAKKLNDAEQFFKRYLAVTEKPGNTQGNANQAYLQLAVIAEERKNFDAALELLGKIDDGAEFIPATVRRANLLVRMNRLDDARQMLKDAAPSSARERVQLIQIEAQILREANQPRAAFEVLQAALAAQPEQAELLYDHAMLAEKLNQLDVMESSLRSVIRLRPDSAQAYNALGYSLADRKLRLPEALALIERAMTLAPNDGAITDSMGWVHYRLGNLDKALEYLQRAYLLQPDAEVATHLGEVLWVMGKHKEAQRLWREAGQKEPQNEVLRETLARLNAGVAAR